MKKLLLLMMAFSAAISYAQTKTVQGTVTDEKDRPLAGVTVSLKNNAAAQALTAENGTFVLHVPEGETTLVFTHVGYEKQEIKATGSNLQIRLVFSAKNLDDVVVISALGINRKQKSLTYASQTINPGTLTEARDVNFLNALSGKVAGLQVLGSGQPGGSVRLTLRGNNSLSGNNQPLFVVDGVPIENNPGDAGNLDYGNAVANINPDDIESITVLEGPNGAALYGSKASNGAILITLKKAKPGQDGKLGIDVNQDIQKYKITQFPAYQNVYGEGSFMRLTGNNVNNVNKANGGVNMGTSNQSWGAPMLGQPYNTFGGTPMPDGYVPQPNNVKDFYQDSYTSSSNISLSKADANGAFRLSYGLVKGNDVIDNLNKITKHNATLTASRNFGSKIRIDTRLQYTNYNTKNRMVKNLDVANPLATYVYMARSTPLSGLWPYEDANGNAINTGTVNDTEDPYWSIYANSNADTRSAFNGGITATANITSALRFRGQVVGDLATLDNYVYKELGGKKTPNGFYSNDLRRQNNWYYEGILMYNKPLMKNLSFDALAGTSFDNRNTLDRFASISTLLVHNMPSIGNANSVPSVGESLYRLKTLSVFGKATLGYKEFLYLDVSARNEWSSSLPPGNNSYFYPMIGGGFVFSEFINNRNIISSGKIRVNFAKVGNSTSPYQLLNTYATQGLYMGSPIMAYTTTLKNANLKPEQSTSREIGLDLTLFRNRINLSATYYRNSNINQIITAQTPYETGFNNRIVNAGEIQNKGFEISVAATPVQTQNFTWRTTVNFSANRNKVVSLLPSVNRIQMGGRLGMSVNAMVGQPFGIQIGNRPYRVGDTILVASSGRAIVEPNVITGDPNPKFIGGWQNTFNYKGFTLQVTATIRYGGVLFSESYGRAMFQGTTVASLAGRNDYFFSNFILGESDPERLGVGQTVGTTATRYRDSARNKGLAYPNAYLAKTDPVTGVQVIDKNGRYMVGQKFNGQVYPQLILGNDKVTNDVPFLTFDATSIRISEIVLGYSIPKKVLGKSFVKGVYAALTGRNVWQIFQRTPIGIDPESTAGTTNGTMGIESGGSFPYATMGATLKISF
jgi:TonB-linked SusC/RagA family outer membrane protein